MTLRTPLRQTVLNPQPHHVFNLRSAQGRYRALTEYLYVDELAHYTAVEIDRDLVPGLRSRFPKVDVLAQDILQADIADLLQSQSQPWRIIGNLPYNISTPLIIKLIELLDEQPQQVVDMVFMVQKEIQKLVLF